MYKKQRKIPTLIALLLLFSAMGSVAYFDDTLRSLTSSASPQSAPVNVHVSNVTASGFTVSWVTDAQSIGAVVIKNSQKQQVSLDDLDTDNTPRPRNTHAVTVSGLLADTPYSIQIISGSRRTCNDTVLCPSLSQKTASQTPIKQALPPVKGKILMPDGTPAVNALVYVTVGKSTLLSTRSDSSGLWIISLASLRAQDLASDLLLADTDLTQITVERSPKERAQALTDVKSIRQNVTIPPITIGNSYNFLDLLAKRKNTLAQALGSNTLGTATQTVPAAGPGPLLFPRVENDTTPETKPRFRGISKPNSKVTIRIQPTSQSAVITTAKDGSWAWQPPRALSPGKYTITVNGTDNTNKPYTASRTFYVLKSGERVLGDATPSASIVPSPSPTTGPIASPSATIAASPSATIAPTATLTPAAASPTQVQPTSGQTPPRSGSILPTYLIGASVGLLSVAAVLLLLP